MRDRTTYHRQWRASKKLDQIPHGTQNGYGGYGCRCDDCRTAHRDHMRTYRKRANESSWNDTITTPNASPTNDT